jgi:hypothetical protein
LAIPCIHKFLSKKDNKLVEFFSESYFVVQGVGGVVNWNGNDWAFNCDFKNQVVFHKTAYSFLTMFILFGVPYPESENIIKLVFPSRGLYLKYDSREFCK